MTAPQSPATAPQPRTRLLRRAALWLLPLALLVLLALVPLVIEPWLSSKVRSAAGLAGLEIAPETQIAVSLFGGRITITKLDLREYVEGKPRSLMQADTAELDADVLACLGGDIVLDNVVLEGASGDFRRRGDGTIPLITPPPEERGGIDWSKLDWWEYARKAYEYHQNRDKDADATEAQPTSATPATPAKPPRQRPAHDWNGAHTYEPEPGPAGPAMRVLIRRLSASGRDIQLPDDTPFAVTSFTVKGLNLGWGRHEQGTDWGLDVQTQTRGAGTLNLGFGAGRAKVNALALPLQALAHPALAGETIARHGASGLADVVLDLRWAERLDGTVQAKITGLKLAPQAPSQQEAQVAQIVNRLDGKPLDWTMKLGGTPQDPQVTDNGLTALVKDSLGDAAKQAAIDEGGKLLNEQLRKNDKVQQLQKNEEVQKAQEKAKDLLKGWGK